MPDYFPVFLDLRGRPCLVVGGGEIAERKTRRLIEAGARVTVVSPELTTGLALLAESRVLTCHQRRFRTSDVRKCALVIAATGDLEVDAAVADAARRRRALVNVVDRPALSDLVFPSVLRRGELQIAVSTGGRSPALAREIREQLEPLFGPELAAFVERVGRERHEARALVATTAERLEAGMRVATAALREFHGNGTTGGVMRVAEHGGAEDALIQAVAQLSERLIAARPGLVYREAIRLLERALLEHVLARTGRNQLRAARLLGLNRNTLRKRGRALDVTMRTVPRSRREPDDRAVVEAQARA